MLPKVQRILREISFRGKEVLDGRLPACPHFSLNTKGASSRKIEWELSFFPIHSNPTFSYYLAGGSSGEFKLKWGAVAHIATILYILIRPLTFLPFLSSFCVNFVNSLYFKELWRRQWLRIGFMRNSLTKKEETYFIFFSVKPTEKEAQNERAEQASRWAGERWDERAWRLDESKKKSLIIDSD